ncbi:hypothetical protein [Paenibacillus puerhi]|uniref:hypothetical protein n=1 Tax=Paenibacillus puerhi TaxID=2692622 RepID=UPI0013576091|nr:hypothetical protein [Paenibacillus puerhi]
MNKKSFIVTMSTFLLTTGLLYGAGHAFTIPWLMFHHEYIQLDTGFRVTTGSLVPGLIGLAASGCAELMYNMAYRRKKA